MSRHKKHPRRARAESDNSHRRFKGEWFSLEQEHMLIINDTFDKYFEKTA